MTSRERVLMALEHREPDRVPIDFGSTRVTGIAAIAYRNLKEYLKINSGDIKLYDLMQQLAEPEIEVIERLGGDVVQVHRLEPAFGISIKNWKKGKLSDGSECLVPEDFSPIRMEDGSYEIRNGNVTVARMPPEGFYYDIVDFPFKNASSIEDVDSFKWPLMTDEEMEFLRTQAEHLHKKTDYAVIGEFEVEIVEGGQWLCGLEKFMTDLIVNRDFVEHLMDKMVENYIENLKRYFEAVGDYIDIIQLGDDIGSQEGLQMSPKMYREVIKPRHEKVYRFVKENTKAYIFFHSCGSIMEVIPDLIDIGVDIINPVQTSAKGMDPAMLKKKYGKNLVFWGGGCDTQKTLPFGTLDEIRRETRERIKIFAPGGGYVFNPVHNIQADILPEKIVAMFDSAREYGKYPI